MTPKPPAYTMSEGDLQFAVIALAKNLGLLVHHCRAAKLGSGKWGTPIQGNAGFTDLVIAGLGGVIFRELKNDALQPSPEQMTWMGTLEAAGADVAIWRPQQWRDKTIENALKALAKPRAQSAPSGGDQ